MTILVFFFRANNNFGQFPGHFNPIVTVGSGAGNVLLSGSRMNKQYERQAFSVATYSARSQVVLHPGSIGPTLPGFDEGVILFCLVVWGPVFLMLTMGTLIVGLSDPVGWHRRYLCKPMHLHRRSTYRLSLCVMYLDLDLDSSYIGDTFRHTLTSLGLLLVLSRRRCCCCRFSWVGSHSRRL